MPWILFHAAIVLLMVLEYLLHLAFPEPRRKALYALVMWTGAALGLAAIIAHMESATAATQYLAGFSIEQALSVDNLLVFLLLFNLFTIPPLRQPRVLFWGILGAIVMRGAFIAAGLGLLEHFHWVSYAFGVVLLIAAVRLMRPSEPTEHGKTPSWITWLSKLHPISTNTDHFFTREAVEPGGKVRRMGTVLLLALVAVELTDIVFALDSIPAVLSITREPFLAYTSNIMAVMGLRSLYVLLAAMLSRLRFLHIGLAVLLAFAALKMLLSEWIEIGPVLSLAIIAGVLAVTVVASLIGSKPSENMPA